VQSRHALVTVASLVVAFLLGGMVAMQAHINGRLATELGAGLTGAAVASMISFGSGFVLLCLICGLTPSGRAGLRRIAVASRQGRLRPWHLLGGLAGALLIVAQSVTVATIGVALFTVVLVAGQVSSAMLVDRFGLGPSGTSLVTPGRAAGAGLAVGAVGLAVSEHLTGAALLAPAVLLLALLPLAAGAGVAWQQAVNGQVSLVGTPFPAAWVNFVVGTVVLALFLLATLGGASELNPPPTSWWLYLGGLFGVTFISSAAILVRVLGVLVFGLAAIAGQVITALVIDLLLTDLAVGPLTFSGAGLTLIGVAVAALASRPRRGPPSSPPSGPPSGPRRGREADPRDASRSEHLQ
jgi:bacterial/archaeal transporter family-2 protein